MNDAVSPDTVADTDRRARQAALAAATEVVVDPTAVIEYRSGGRLLIVGSHDRALAARERLPVELPCCVLATAVGESPAAPEEALFFSNGRTLRLTGHLGEYSLTVGENEDTIDIARLWGSTSGHFDLVLDLEPVPLLDPELPPFGYFATRGNDRQLDTILAELVELVGEFEKPKYFDYDPAICAHGSSKLTGCTRCLEACPTGAITSLVERIAVDPYYCQGGGSCAAACPTGAIIYSYPKPADTIDRLRLMLRAFREAGGRDAVLLFHDGEVGQQRLQALEPLPGRVIPVLVEEIGSIGLETWLAALAFGARRVVLLDTVVVPARVRRELRAQLGYAGAILAGMGYPDSVIEWLSAEEEAGPRLTAGTAMPDILPAGFAGSNEKRNMLFAAIDWLYAQAPQPRAEAALPAGAPFGRIRVDRDACTLCMGCVSVCPAAALNAGGDSPRLDFIEANCVQCGLCETACPEDAVTLEPRILYDREARRRRRTQHEEAPFYCIACGTPFAPRSVIDRMTRRLSGHWMFQDDKALRRLQMCGECRVRDMFENGT